MKKYIIQMTTPKLEIVHVKTLFPFTTVKSKRQAKVFETNTIAPKLLIELFDETPGHFQAIEYDEPSGNLKIYTVTSCQTRCGGMAVIAAYDAEEAEELLNEDPPGCNTQMSFEPDVFAVGLPRVIERNFYIE